jgi:hypothetical protein
MAGGTEKLAAFALPFIKLKEIQAFAKSARSCGRKAIPLSGRHFQTIDFLSQWDCQQFKSRITVAAEVIKTALRLAAVSNVSRPTVRTGYR